MDIPLKLSVIGRAGVPAELLEDAARSLLNLLNEHQRGVAEFGRAAPAAEGSKDFLGFSPDIMLASGSLASAWLVPAVQGWLGSEQKPVAGVKFVLQNDEGEDYVVEIGPNAPPEVVAKLSSAVARIKKS
jgi:hypothetical protein